MTRELQALAGRAPRSSAAPNKTSHCSNRRCSRAGRPATLFAVIGALLGFLFAFNAILLTVPERRQAIADLRLSGTRRSAIVQLAVLPGAVPRCRGERRRARRRLRALAVGVPPVDGLPGGGVHAERRHRRAARDRAGRGLGGMLVTLPCLGAAAAGPAPRASTRRASTCRTGCPATRSGRPAAPWLIAASSTLLALAERAVRGRAVERARGERRARARDGARGAAGVRRRARRGARRSASARRVCPTLALALGGVRGTTLRSIALAATGAVALFGSVALGGARANLLSGIHGFAASYAAGRADLGRRTRRQPGRATARGRRGRRADRAAGRRRIGAETSKGHS